MFNIGNERVEDGVVFFSLAAGIDALQKSLIYTIEWKNKASVTGLLVILW